MKHLPPKLTVYYYELIENLDLQKTSPQTTLEAEALTPEIVESTPHVTQLSDEIFDGARDAAMSHLEDGTDYSNALAESKERISEMTREFLQRLENAKSRENAVAELEYLLSNSMTDKANDYVSMMTKMKDGSLPNFPFKNPDLYPLEVKRYRERQKKHR